MDREKLLAALSKPTSDPDALGIMHSEVFNPWDDVIQGISGGYSSECDDLMIEALEAVRDRRTFDFITARGFSGEFALYVLAGHGLTDYGTSPRGGWPYHLIEDLWQPLIDKWKAYRDTDWGG